MKQKAEQIKKLLESVSSASDHLDASLKRFRRKVGQSHKDSTGDSMETLAAATQHLFQDVARSSQNFTNIRIATNKSIAMLKHQRCLWRVWRSRDGAERSSKTENCGKTIAPALEGVPFKKKAKVQPDLDISNEQTEVIVVDLSNEDNAITAAQETIDVENRLWMTPTKRPHVRHLPIAKIRRKVEYSK